MPLSFRSLWDTVRGLLGGGRPAAAPGPDYKAAFEQLAQAVQKSYGSRVMSSLSMPLYGFGGYVSWLEARHEQVRHFRNHVYTAVKTICEIGAGQEPNVSYTHDLDQAPNTPRPGTGEGGGGAT
jgi:hypothetical protein